MEEIENPQRKMIQINEIWQKSCDFGTEKPRNLLISDKEIEYCKEEIKSMAWWQEQGGNLQS